MKARRRRYGIGCLLLLLFMSVVPPLRAQESPPDPVLELMAQMSPEAKVGQLVLVTYPGDDVGSDAEIVNLIRDYGVGGVVLRARNGNFGAGGIAAGQLISMTNQLQMAAWEPRLPSPPFPDGSDAASVPAPYIPLAIGVQAYESGLVPSSLVSGASDLPTPMAIGATWDPALSESVGEVLGRELAALGFNLFLGPNLDVLYTPRPGNPADLGTRVFGGDPFWVGQHGTAYIRGLHQGSAGQLLVAPRHLPGLGSADRLPEEEIPTVQKPLEQLKQIELVPFFAAANEFPGADSAADAFLVTHIRYRGFQGNNIRRQTRPISLDATALKLVVGLPEVAPWRAEGGVLIADDLGLPSVHRSYDPSGVSFNPRRVIQDALSAGNDLLILDRFGSTDDWDVHFRNVQDSLRFLANLYRDQPTFQAGVDNAVYRILNMKLRLYPQFEIDDVLRDATLADELLGGGELVNSDVALNALSLIFPLSEDLLPAPPQEGESIVVFTQESAIVLGEGLRSTLPLDAEAVPRAVLRFYGPQGTGVVRPNLVQGFSFDDLLIYLDEISALEEPVDLSPVATAVYRALRDADWIIFATRGAGLDDSAAALKRFLAGQADLLSASIGILAFGPPYDLDQTETSKLSVYYALYSTGNTFVEAGVRGLFQGVGAPGDSPVDIPALNYNIARQTMPDPEQTISLSVVDEYGDELTPAARASIHVGDMIRLRTGVIVDGNGRVVPDGTPVQFVLHYPVDGGRSTVVAETSAGVAATAVSLDRVGQLDITAQSEPAVSSVRLELTIRDDGLTITEIAPTATPTLEPTATPLPSPTPTVTPNPLLGTTERLPDPPYLPTPRRSRLVGWGIVGAVTVFGVAFFWARERSRTPELAATIALASVVGSLSGYILVMAAARWWLPVVRYGLVGREYLTALVTLGVGIAVLLLALWLTRDAVQRRNIETRARVKGYRRGIL